MSKIEGDENEFTLDGVTYVAVKQRGCTGCAFKVLGNKCVISPPCGWGNRIDRQSSIFVVRHETPHLS